MPAKDPRERAARALCRKDGHPENIKFEGKPMWQSYLDVVDAVIEAIADGPAGDATPIVLVPQIKLGWVPPDKA